MSSLDNVNEVVFENLEEILKRLNKKFDLKLYAVTVDQNLSCKNVIRIRRTLSDMSGKDTEINQEPLKELSRVIHELDMPLTPENKEFKELMKDQLFSEMLQSIQESTAIVETNESRESGIIDFKKNSYEPFKTSLIYSNHFSIEIGEIEQKIKIIVVIRNVDKQIQEIFYDYPQLSFLRMLLDYYFSDYFVEENNILKLDGDRNMGKKYNEDGTQFTRRMTRLFMGKVQSLIQDNNNMEDIFLLSVQNELSSQYYINILLEKIDDISTRTYEGSSPFGCMLFLNQTLLRERNIINYTVRFQEKDRILLDDSKLIRKLLELTDNDGDLYLIADDKYIHGIGQINWNEFKNDLLFKVEFRGLSKYNLLLVTTTENEYRLGQVVTENEKKVFKTEKKLEIVLKNLLQISFKSPELGEEGFTTEKFNRIIKSQFFDQTEKNDYSSVEILERIVRKAKEQKHGTMVVITDKATAEEEVKRLKKQSTLIEPTEITPDFIKYLTSIDGAVYFDNEGVCHAIGVILDGIAEEHLGDSSRGARFNSAHRYLFKIKDKKCVIAIISEDGMVNLIPELDDEEPIRVLFQQFIDQMNESEHISSEVINLFDSKVASYKNIDYHHYFTVANAFLKKKNYEYAINFYQKGLEDAGNNYIIPKHYRGLANAYFSIARDLKSKMEYTKALNGYEKYMTSENEEELNLNDFNDRALILVALGDIENKKAEKTNLYNRALKDNNKAISLAEHHILYSNRAFIYERINQWEECFEDIIFAEMMVSNEDYLNRIMGFLNQMPELFEHCMITYLKFKDNNMESVELSKRFQEHRDKLSQENPEVAATLENYQF